VDLALDSSWDLSVSDRDLAKVTGGDAIAQHLAQRLKTWMGEWFRDLREGVPYLQQVLVKQSNPVVLDGIFKSVIVNTPGIVELTAFDLLADSRTRQLKVAFGAINEEGEQIYFEEVMP